MSVAVSPAGLPAEQRARLERVLDRLPCTAGRPRTVEALEGGLTNVNVKVTTDERAVVVRLCGDDGDLLAIDRDNEHTSSQRAAASGAAPEVVAYLPDEDVLVVAWVEGRTYGPADLHDETGLRRVADACRLLHAGESFDRRFDMFAVQRRYLEIVTERGFRLPDRYREVEPAFGRVEQALGVAAGPLVPCNNDLLAANFVDDGDRVWIIDYEYAGNNDVCFELGNVWSESTLPDGHLDLLLEAYRGRPSPQEVARARLFAVVSQYGWTLWASIQDAMSPIDFDFWTWGMEKYDRCLATLTSDHLDALLDRAAAP